MMELIVDLFLWFLMVYLSVGILFSIYFLAKGAAVLDEGARNTPWHFKVIIIPGTILLWLMLLMKILKKKV